MAGLELLWAINLFQTYCFSKSCLYYLQIVLLAVWSSHCRSQCLCGCGLDKKMWYPHFPFVQGIYPVSHSQVYYQRIGARPGDLVCANFAFSKLHKVSKYVPILGIWAHFLKWIGDLTEIMISLRILIFNLKKATPHFIFLLSFPHAFL